ncbi:MAG: hypothetical protein IPK26_22325 [Planctomycetes bacterium]|nr:hypothetical protein [Planctomycetota bacterium]
MAVKPIMPASRSFASAKTHLFDFVWPAATALWNLRWQVGGFCNVIPDARNELLQARFCEGSGVRGANLRRACIDNTWEAQQEEFARILLVNICAHFEAWCKSLALTFGRPALEKELQTWAGKRNVVDAVNSMRSHVSGPMQGSVEPGYKAQAFYNTSRLEPLMRCYRFFKEARNCLAHDGGLVSTGLCNAYGDWLPHAQPGLMGVKEVPQHSAPVLGVPVALSLRGVVGLTQVCLRLVQIVDAEVSGTLAAEAALCSYLKDKAGPRQVPRHRVKKKLAVLLKHEGIPVSLVTDALVGAAVDRGAIRLV